MYETIYSIMEIIGTVAFAISGAVLGIKKQMDVLGVVILGLTTAVGGGIIRDLIIGKTPPSAFIDYKYALISVITALFIFLIWPYLVKHQNYHAIREQTLLFMDTIGLAIFTSNGVIIAYQFLQPNTTVFLLAFVGVITGVGGGVLRDLFADEPPYIFHKHFYATASIIGALLTVSFLRLYGELSGIIIGCTSIIVLRLLAAKFHWNLPKAKES